MTGSVGAPKKSMQKPIDLRLLQPGLERVLPDLIEEVNYFIGKPRQRLTKTDLHRHVSRAMRGVNEALPFAIALSALTGEMEPGDAVYVLLQGLVKVLLKQVGRRTKPGQDSVSALLSLIKAQAEKRTPLDRSSEYRRVRNGLRKLITAAVTADAGRAESKELIDHYHKQHGQEFMSFVSGLKARHNLSRNAAPRRLTQRAVEQLSNEYRANAAIFEKRLRVLVGLKYIATGEHVSYADLLKQDLGTLLQSVNNKKLLHFLRRAVDPHVRNSLAHGYPEVLVKKKSLKFVDRNKKQNIHEITWTIEEFYKRTKALTMAVLALAHLEPLFNYVSLKQDFQRIHSYRPPRLWEIHLPVRKLSLSIRFYRPFLGQDVRFTDVDRARIAVFRFSGAQLVLRELPEYAPVRGTKEPHMDLSFVTGDLEEVASELSSRKISFGRMNSPDGLNQIVAVDPDGYRVRFGNSRRAS